MAQSEVGEEAWRRRQMYAISLGGRASVLSRSRYEESVLRPNGVEGFDVDDDEDFVWGSTGVGAGGEGGKSDVASWVTEESVVVFVFCSCMRAL